MMKSGKRTGMIQAVLMAAVLASAQELPVDQLRGFNHGESSASTPQEVYTGAADWGAKLIRMHFWPGAVPSPFWTNWSAFLDDLDARVARCEAAGLKVIINPKFVPFDNGINMETTEFWEQPGLDSAFIRVWRDIATRLKKYGATLYGYDLYNEPLDRSILPLAPPRWRPLAVKLLRTIRAIDPDVWIIYEAGPGGVTWAFNNLTPLPDRKVMYSPHMYEPQGFSHQGVYGNPVGVPYPGNGWDRDRPVAELQPVRDFQLLYDVPVVLGEFGNARTGNPEDINRWYDDMIPLFEEYDWSWTLHAWKDGDFWNPELADTSVIRTLKGYMGLNTTPVTNGYRPLLEAPGHHEAEYANSFGAAVREDDSFEFTGGGYMVLSGPGSFVRWDSIAVPESGDYELSLGYANASGAERSVDVAVNGASAGSLGLPATLRRDQWRFARLTARLNAGLNSVQVTAGPEGGLDLDNLVLSRVSSAPLLDHNFGTGMEGWTVSNASSSNEALGMHLTSTDGDGVIHRVLPLTQGTWTLTVQAAGAAFIRIQGANNSTTYFQTKILSMDAARNITAQVEIPDDTDKRIVLQNHWGEIRDFTALMVRIDSASAPFPSGLRKSLPVRPDLPQRSVYARRGRTAVLSTGPAGSRAGAGIFHCTGRRITTVTPDPKGALIWDLHDRMGRPVPPGIYLYRISGNSNHPGSGRENWIIVR